MREAIIYRGEDGYWVAECPSLPGCISQGETKEKAIENIKEAIEGYISALKEDNLSIPDENFDTMVVVYRFNKKVTFRKNNFVNESLPMAPSTPFIPLRHF